MTKLDSTRDNTGHGRKGGFIAKTGQWCFFEQLIFYRIKNSFYFYVKLSSRHTTSPEDSRKNFCPVFCLGRPSTSKKLAQDFLQQHCSNIFMRVNTPAIFLCNSDSNIAQEISFHVQRPLQIILKMLLQYYWKIELVIGTGSIFL